MRHHDVNTKDQAPRRGGQYISAISQLKQHNERTVYFQSKRPEFKYREWSMFSTARKHHNAICGELAWEKAMDLSQDRRRDEFLIKKH
jgi:hypothetical protein